ncbi:hypothetical protein [Billgrantia montanilacus]|uniref:Cytochrome C n=1 Tax=Billgrantia montanilacus TaxID=2282305 RepID=A0A368U2R7_9GAMM|nr:hypothetical protein [Halomonas montanilacus]RCV90846.1 hypothetical protein DU505_02775 [Halomonas montanilacus]
MKNLKSRCQGGIAVGAIVLLPATFTLAQTGNGLDVPAKVVEHGRYIAIISGCNDCHTPNYGVAEGQVPEELWLTGDALGWRGPWGTTYPPNLRLLADKLDEQQWNEMTHNLRTRPPMPWFNLNEMSREDSSALYHYIRSFETLGEPAPPYLPPGETPPAPYVDFILE